jgi:very-short-patch-repair endonuclease
MRQILFLILFIPELSFAQASFCIDFFHIKKTQQVQILDLEIKNMISLSKNAVRSGTYTQFDKDYFRKILSLKPRDLQNFSNSQLISLYSLFAHWNLLPPRSFQYELLKVLGSRLGSWTKNDYREFSFARKLTPMKLTAEFSTMYKKGILKNFHLWDIKTQIEILGAELLHQTYFKSRELHTLLEITTESFAANSQVLRIKPLKELFRALLFLRDREPSHFFAPIVKLETELEKQMNLQNLSLNSDGRSGDQNQRFAHKKGWLRARFEEKLDIIFASDKKIEEYSSPGVIGFYDPVDLYFPNQRLIVEWDGFHHYFQYLKADGSVVRSQENLILRPLDQAKDTVLRKNGYRILRISPLLNNQIETLSGIRRLLEEQNTSNPIVFVNINHEN